MKPTKPGWYWLRQNWVSVHTGDMNKAKWECGLVFMGLRARKRTGPQELMVRTCLFGGFTGPIADLPDYWDWSAPIEEPK